MSLYAQTPARRARQVAGDLAVVAWVIAWVAVGRAVTAAVARLGEPAVEVRDAGRSLEQGLRAAAEGVARAPLLGDELRAPFDAAGDAARSLAQAGAGAQAAVDRAALLAGLAVAVWPIVLVVGGWLLHRWRWARRAGQVRRVLAARGGQDLLALRALAAAPVSRLAGIGPDAADGWRRGDPDTVAALAALTLHDAGLRPASTAVSGRGSAEGPARPGPGGGPVKG